MLLISLVKRLIRSSLSSPLQNDSKPVYQMEPDVVIIHVTYMDKMTKKRIWRQEVCVNYMEKMMKMRIWRQEVCATYMEKMMKMATRILRQVVLGAFCGFFFTHWIHRQQEAMNRTSRMKATGAAAHNKRDYNKHKTSIYRPIFQSQFHFKLVTIHVFLLLYNKHNYCFKAF